MTDLSIIIVSRNTRALLDDCLASIFAGEYPFSFRVVVVDNNSDDGTPGMVVSKYPDALLIRNEKQVGHSAANNTGIRNTDSRLVLLLDPDTEVFPETISAMVNFMNRYPHVGITGCQLVNTDGSPQTSWFNIPVPLSHHIENWRHYPGVVRRLFGFRPRHPLIKENGARRVDIVKSACLMIRRETIDQIGLLDETSFRYADDTDWCIRARRKSWESYVLTHHNIVHHASASADHETFRSLVSSRRNALYLYRRHYPKPFRAIWTFMIYHEILYGWLLNSFRLRARPGDSVQRERHRAYSELAGEIFRNRRNGIGQKTQ